MAWSRIRGHDRLVEAFTRVRGRGRLAHAYLFVGPAGVGKKMFARELAKSLLCEAAGSVAEGFSACDRCDGCVQIEANSHPDFFQVGKPEDKNEFPIEVMKELCQQFMLKSASGRGKVAIVDDADDLNEESANCFLKTLEEPPRGSVFILLGTNSQHQLPTILSRCHLVRFAPLPTDFVREILAQQGVSAELLPKLARLAQGSPGRALELADPEIWAFRETALRGLATPNFDSGALAKQFAEFTEEAGKEGALQRRRAQQTLGLIVEALQDARVVRLGGEPRTIEPNERPVLDALAARLSDEKFPQLLERFLQSEEQIRRYIQLGLVLEGLFEGLGRILDPAPAGR